MSIKINQLEIENVKRIKAIKIQPTENGLTLIGGNNNQGKTSVLDSIAWALGGERYRPSDPKREGSAIPPTLKVVMSNGLVVERSGKNSVLKVTDPSGNKAGQQLLDAFVSKLAIDLPKFMEASSKEKADTLLQILGIGEKLESLEHAEMTKYNERLAIGRIADQKKKFAKEQPYYPDAPSDLMSASDLIKQQQDILARNGENHRKRELSAQIEKEYEAQNEKIRQLSLELDEALKKLEQLKKDLKVAQKTAEELRDESTVELEQNIEQIDQINRLVRANMDKEKAEEDAKGYQEQYDLLTSEIEAIRDKKKELLSSVKLPLPELSVENGELLYKGQKWDNMSGSDRLKVSTAVVRQLNPECGFVLLDKLEQMDLNTLQSFGKWLETEGLQAIATRVSTGGECQIIIEDGYATRSLKEPKKWEVGTF